MLEPVFSISVLLASVLAGLLGSLTGLGGGVVVAPTAAFSASKFVCSATSRIKSTMAPMFFAAADISVTLALVEFASDTAPLVILSASLNCDEISTTCTSSEQFGLTGVWRKGESGSSGLGFRLQRYDAAAVSRSWFYV